MPSLRRTQWAKFRIAAVSFLALLILGVLVALLMGGTLIHRISKLYIYLPDSSGVARDSSVRLNGIPVGRVSALRFSGLNDPARIVVVEMSVETHYLSQIPRDTVAALTSENVIGEKYVDLTKGRSPLPVQPGVTLAFQPPSDVLKTLDLAQFDAQMRDIDSLLADIQAGKSPVGRLVMDDQLYNDVVLRVTELRKAIDEAISPQEAAGRLIYRDEGYHRILDPLQRLDGQLARLQRGEGAGRYLVDTGPHDELQARVGEIRRALAGLHAGPLLRKDDLYTGWNRRAAALAEAVDRLNAGESSMGQFFASDQSYQSLEGFAREAGRGIREFRADPQKFLRLKVF